MPLHGLKADLELAVLVASAGVFSYFVTSQVFSSVLFVALLGSLFFLMGLHVNLEFFKALSTRSKPLFLSIVGVYLVAPLIAYLLSYSPGSIGEAVLVVGISASAFGSPKIWANISKSDGDLASYAATFSLIGSLLFIPLLIYILPVNIDIDFLLGNSLLVVLPFLAGVLSQRFENSYLQDAKFHFSRLSFWLIVVITLVQARLVYAGEGFVPLLILVLSSLVFVAFIVMSFGYSHVLSRLSGQYEKEARSIGYISSSKSIGVALFLAAHLSAEVTLLVCLYYFIRQFMGVMITDIYLHGEPKFLERAGF